MRQARVYHPMSLGLGIAVVRARRIADETIAAADVVASLADPTAQARSHCRSNRPANRLGRSRGRRRSTAD
jgi:hypothetical protein